MWAPSPCRLRNVRPRVPGPQAPLGGLRVPPTCPASCAAHGPACSVGTPQLGGMQPSGQAARFPASRPGPARAPPPPSRRPATTVAWDEGLSLDCGVSGKEGLGPGFLDPWTCYGLQRSQGRQRDILSWGFEARRTESPPLLRGPSCPQAPRCPLPDPQAQGSPGPRLSKPRKLAKPQGLPFIAQFPLGEFPPGPRLSKFLPLSPPPCPQQAWQGAGVQPSRFALLRPRCSGSQTPTWLGRPPAGDPALRCPHSSTSRPRELLNGKGRVSQGAGRVGSGPPRSLRDRGRGNRLCF